jgi:hypothetical protein
MSKLHRRITRQAASAGNAAAQYHPAGNADTPMVMPMVHVQFYGGGAYVQQMTPAAMQGTAVAATVPGRFGAVPMAGNRRYGGQQ